MVRFFILYAEYLKNFRRPDGGGRMVQTFVSHWWGEDCQTWVCFCQTFVVAPFWCKFVLGVFCLFWMPGFETTWILIHSRSSAILWQAYENLLKANVWRVRLWESGRVCMQQQSWFWMLSSATTCQRSMAALILKTWRPATFLWLFYVIRVYLFWSYSWCYWKPSVEGDRLSNGLFGFVPLPTTNMNLSMPWVVLLINHPSPLP